MQNDILNFCLKNYGQEIMRPGLDRIQSALKEILPKFNDTKVVIIAGTNGKGETTLRLSELLKDEVHFVWTSPHIERITERFRDQNSEISPELLERIVFDCHEKLQQLKISLSFYEFLFFVFCTWASEKRPKYLLLEVGLGGRLDAVNAFNADLVLLPSLSRDHQEFLGNRYSEILKEKLGTLRPNATLIHFLESRYLTERAQSICDTIGAKVLALNSQSSIPVYQFSLRNQELATAAFSHLRHETFIPNTLKAPFPLEHRGESRKGEHEWIFYGSHNVDGMRKLILFLHSGTYNFSRPPYDSVIVAFSKRPMGDLKVMMKMLKASQLGKIVVTTFPHPKALSAKESEVLSSEEGLAFVQDIESYVQGQNKDQRMLVTGSYYFMGHLKSLPCCR